jgi:hypothetical protein
MIPKIDLNNVLPLNFLLTPIRYGVPELYKTDLVQVKRFDMVLPGFYIRLEFFLSIV